MSVARLECTRCSHPPEPTAALPFSTRLPFSTPPRLPQLALMQAVLDHHHSSYSAELRAAGLALAKQEEAVAAAAGASADAAEFPGSS